MTLKRTFDFAEYALQNFPKDDALTVKRTGKWERFSSDDLVNNANYFSCGLVELGFKKDDKIATVSNNRPEWNFVDIGMSQIGVVHVPIYPTVSEAEYEHILKHSETKIVIVSSEDRYNYIKPIVDKIKNIEKIYSFDKIKGVTCFDEIIELGKKNIDRDKDKLIEIKNSIKEDDLCSIIYTSGTTGLSKGVMMTHKNFVSNVLASQVAVPSETKIAISFLPLNHVFERMLNYLFMYMGISINYAENIEVLVDNIKEIRPHIFASVPRVLEKIYDKIYAKGINLTGIKKKLFFQAIELGQKYDPSKKQSLLFDIKLAMANKLIFTKWRDALGGRIITIVSGGAALQPRLARVFAAAGIPILEGYGLTETAPVISVNRLNNIRPGTVGEILEGVEVKIAKDGEILFKGPNLMKGYYRDEKKTKEVINKDGFFHTGDMGRLDGKNLKITGRKKELFKLSTGKYIAPELIENTFKESIFIEQLMIVGDGEKFCAAIICPNFEFLHSWASEHKIHFKDNLELITNNKVIKRFEQEIEIFNKTFDKTMKIKKFELVCEEWTPESEELSPTLKLKRRIINKKYNVKIKHIYGHTKEKGHLKKI